MPKESKPANLAKTHLKDILLLFSIPVGIMAVIIGFTYIPQFLANPEYNFIYCKGYLCAESYRVDPNGRLQTTTVNNQYSYRPIREMSLYHYDVSRDSSRPITLEEAQQTLLDPSSKSPDDYVLERSRGGGSIFYGSSSREWTLSKGITSKPVHLDSSDITFIGWVFKASWTTS